MTERCDELIAKIRSRFHEPSMNDAKNGDKEPCDVLVVAHGHILRAFAGRWIGRNIAENPSMILEAGGFGTLRYGFCNNPALDSRHLRTANICYSYEHQNINEPAIVLGGAFVVDAVEKDEAKDERTNLKQ